LKFIKRPNGFRIDYRDAKGSRHRVVLPAQTVAEAKQMFEHLRSKALTEGGLLPKAVEDLQSVNLSQAIEEFKTVCFVAKCESSQRTDEMTLKCLLEFVGDIPMNELNDVDLAEYVRHEFLKRKLRASSVNRKITSLKSFLRWCFEDRTWTLINLGQKLRKVQGPCREARPLEDRELSLILSKANDELRLQMLLASTWGLRVGEVCSLEWAVFNFERESYKVGGTKNFKPKNGDSKTLFLTENLRAALLEWKLKQPLKTRWVFPEKDGRPRDSKAVSVAFHRAADRAGVEDVVFHDLRATAATRLAEHGMGDAVIAKILGHKTTAMARKYSNRVSEDVLRRGIASASESLHEVFGHNLGTVLPFQKSGSV